MAKSLRARMAEDAAAPVVSNLDMDRVRQAVRDLLDLQGRVIKAAQELERLQKRVRSIETEVIPELLDGVGVEKMLVDGRTIKVKTEYYPHVNKDDEQEFFSWLRAAKLDAIIKNELKVLFDRGEDAKATKLVEELLKKKFAVTMKQAIHASTLKAFVKEQQEKGAPLPPMLNINPVRTTEIK